MIQQPKLSDKYRSSYAEALEETIPESPIYRPSQELLSQSLKQEVQKVITPDLRRKEREVQQKILELPDTLGPEYDNIVDPRARRTIMAQQQARLFGQLATLKDEKLLKEGKYEDIIGNFTLQYASETERLQQNFEQAVRKAEILRQRYLDEVAHEERARKEEEYYEFQRPKLALELEQERLETQYLPQQLELDIELKRKELLKPYYKPESPKETGVFSEIESDIAIIKGQNPDMTREDIEVLIRSSLDERDKKLSESQIMSILDKYYPEKTEEEKIIEARFLTDDYLHNLFPKKKDFWFSAKKEQKVADEKFNEAKALVEQMRAAGFDDKAIYKELRKEIEEKEKKKK